jgi:acetoacetyl-CoA synthetase
MDWLSAHRQLHFEDYDALWQWSIEDTKGFWQTIWDYFAVIHHAPYKFVHSDASMPDTVWFEGATLNYAEHIFRSKTEAHPAIIFQSERQNINKSKPVETSWAMLETQVATLADWLRAQGVGKGDRVVAYLPNIPEATISFLATCSLGAIWSSASPDFGTESVVERFQQIGPKVLIATDGYTYNGKSFDKKEVVHDILAHLPTVEQVVTVSYLHPDVGWSADGAAPSTNWHEIIAANSQAKLTFEAVPFSHPIWVLYSSGTTGIPKAITHSHGGVLLEHLKYLTFHNDIKVGERFFWFSTTGWMMWNMVQASLLVGATMVLYDGSPAFPDMNALWDFATESRITHFGTSAPFIMASKKADISPNTHHDFADLRSISSTGAPLPPEGFTWIYEHIKRDLWFCSMSGGTDVCTAFVGGVPTEPVYEGEIQRRALGCAMYAFDEQGESIIGEVGEMVVTKPMPSMPIYFWNDPDKKQYLSSYFDMYEAEKYGGNIWRHGDWLTITERNTLIISGRSDATLNRHGVRIGTAEIYRALDAIIEIKDSLIVNLELPNGEHFMPLFVQLAKGALLDEVLKKRIAQTLRSTYSPRHVPDEVIEIQDIPYTISGKKLETPVKKILMGIPIEKAANKGAMRNPASLDFFEAFALARAKWGK